ncbi:MAG: hypothetical protein Q4P23_00530 [Micrococcaceae bacterium]|nr:hypothetical protein [Micrococcaceae bacterium]
MGSGQELAVHLLQPRRLHSVVVTRSARDDAAGFDAEAIYEEIKDWAEVIVVPTGRITYGLRDSLPSGWEVFGTAARVYPTGSGPHGIPPGRPHVVRAGDSIDRLSTELIDEVLFLPDPRTLVASTSPRPGPGARAADPVRAVGAPGTLSLGTGSHSMLVTGVVTGFKDQGFTALIALDNGATSEIHSDDIYSRVPVGWILDTGTRVAGVHEPGAKGLSIGESLLHPRLLQHYSWGQIIPCLVVEAGNESAVLVPVPGESISVSRADVSSNELDDVDSLLAPGQVVAARLVNAAGLRKLVLVDVDDDEPVAEAPPLFRGGGPWLVIDRDHVPEPGDPPSTKTPAGLPVLATPEKQREALRSALLQIDALKSEAKALRQAQSGTRADELASVMEQKDRYRAENAKLRTLLRTKSEALNQNQRIARKKARTTETTASPEARDKFTRAEEALRHELYLEWVQRIPANEKSLYPWNPGFVVGPKFAASFYSHGPALRGKTLKALIQLLTGRAERMAAREVHPKRTGPGGEDPQSIREDGATCWRMSVESGVAGARRVHYWKLPDGRFELHELVSHDTFEL